MSFSEVILKFAPQKKKLPEIMREIGPDCELTDAIEKASKEMRQAKMREVHFDADA